MGLCRRAVETPLVLSWPLGSGQSRWRAFCGSIREAVPPSPSVGVLLGDKGVSYYPNTLISCLGSF
jgi:hypothetical protein